MPESPVASISNLLRGWYAYFDRRAVLDTYKLIRHIPSGGSVAG
jgi:hypothetical protein